MHLHDLDALRRFVSACFTVLRRNCTWTELACFVTSAEVVKKRFWLWAKKAVWERLMAHSQPVAGPDVLHIDSTGDFAKRNADIKCYRTATGARGSGAEAIGRSRGGLGAKRSFVACDQQGPPRRRQPGLRPPPADLARPARRLHLCGSADHRPAALVRRRRQRIRHRQAPRSPAGSRHRHVHPAQKQPPGPAPLQQSPLPHPAHGRELVLPSEGPPPPQPAARQDGHQLPGVRMLRRSPDELPAENQTLSLDPRTPCSPAGHRDCCQMWKLLTRSNQTSAGLRGLERPQAIPVTGRASLLGHIDQE